MSFVLDRVAGKRQAVLLLPAFLCCSEFVGGCGPVSNNAAVSAPARAAAVTFGDEAAKVTRYHSRRLALSVPLPDARAWHIDEHRQPQLVATHAPTQSKLIVAVFRADALVGRTQCEALSRAEKLVPEGDLRTLEDEAAITQQMYDTRVWVAVEPGVGPEGALVGHVMAFGGFLRKCFAFVFTTQVDHASDEPVLSARLAFARARMLGGLELDAFGVVPHDVPAGPGIAPAY